MKIVAVVGIVICVCAFGAALWMLLNDPTDR
jgi:hypothetical protein